ncbi:hypothetical protein SLA2020_283210 [Shorea laevis]
MESPQNMKQLQRLTGRIVALNSFGSRRSRDPKTRVLHQQALRGAEARYPQIEKLAFVLVTSARKLRPYFQAHTIRVLTDHPLKKVLFKPDTSGRRVNWAIELGEFDIEYLPRTAIKGQAMADFIAKFTNLDN